VPETNAPSPVPRVDRTLFDKPAPDDPGAADPVAVDTVAVDTVAVDTVAEVPTEVISAAAAPRRRHRRSLSPRDVLLRRVARTAVPIVLVAGTLVACTTSSGPPAPPTARVQRTSVTTAVTSSGALTAVTEQNLGFLKGGQVKTVDVKVGQKVTAGEVLATVDDAPARHVLEQQQGQLASQQAALTRLVNATTVTGAQNTTNQAGEILDATQDQASTQVDADQSAVDRAEKQLDFDKDARDDIEDQLDQAESACGASGGTPSSVAVDTSGLLSGILGKTDSDGDGADDSKKERKKQIEAALKAAGSLAGSLVSSSAAAANPACSQVATAQSALTQAERQVEASKTALDAAQNRRDVDEAAGRVQVENARQGLVTAQNNLDSASTDRPSLIAQQRGLVAAAQAAVAAAQKDVDDTVLHAPADGTISAVNGAVGEVLGPSSGTTPLAPGSEGAIPGATGTSTSATAATVSRPGGTQFLVLDNVDTFEAVVPFEESDAVRVAPNQRVDVRFDAIPDLTLPGTVVGVSPSASALSGVISYYVTVGVSQSDPRLRNGLTAQASVITDELRDVLAVPNAAIHRQGGRTQVTVQRFDGQRVVDITPGVVGDTYTQVLSGLSEGDEVVLPTSR
jgi:HlyD family secretion protein